MLAVGDGERVVVGERDARGRPRTLRGPTQAQASTLVAARRNHRSELQATLRPCLSAGHGARACYSQWPPKFRLPRKVVPRARNQLVSCPGVPYKECHGCRIADKVVRQGCRGSIPEQYERVQL